MRVRDMIDQKHVFCCHQLMILLALEATELSEGQAAKLLCVDRVTVREWLQEALRQAKYLTRDGGLVMTECRALRRAMGTGR